MKNKKTNNLNRFTYIILVIMIFVGCTSEPEIKKNNRTDIEKYKIKVMYDCEYIEYDYGLFDMRVYSLTHKGNCKYCIERNKK